MYSNQFVHGLDLDRKEEEPKRHGDLPKALSGDDPRSIKQHAEWRESLRISAELSLRQDQRR